VAQTDPYLRPVVDGVPVHPDDEQEQQPARRGGWISYALLTVLAAVLFAFGWSVGIIYRTVTWIATAFMLGFDTASRD
jgi:hypothetical protein